LFPFAGVIIGCLTVSLTLSVMEGMEYAIFTKLENISFPGKLMNIISTNENKLGNFLQTNNIQSQKGIEDQIIIMNDGEFRFVAIHGIEDFNDFKHKDLIYLKWIVQLKILIYILEDLLL
jgi:ABC-type lipoprotein release transport system permease subunit